MCLMERSASAEPWSDQWKKRQCGQSLEGYQGEGRTMRAELWPRPNGARPSGQGSKPDGCCVCLQKWLSWTIGCNVGCGRSDRENS